MSARQLQPWQKTSTLQINMDCLWLGQTIEVEFELSGESLHDVQWPFPSSKPGRQDKLWEKTCFELFFRTPHQKNYWECNFSPSLDWAVFKFSDYRTQMQDESLSVGSVYFEVDQTKARLLAKFNLPIHLEEPLECSPCAVIHVQDEIQHWALAHHEKKPDFHWPLGFQLSLNRGQL